MADKRHKNSNWSINTNADGTVPHQDAHLAVLMDIRDELQALNGKLGCWRIQKMFSTIERLDRRMARQHPLKGKCA